MTEKFEHLQDIDPKDISKLLVEEIYDEQYPQVKAHFEWIIEKSSNKEVITAATNIVSKVDIIMNLWKNNFSWEVLAATSDDYSNQMVA